MYLLFSIVLLTGCEKTKETPAITPVPTQKSSMKTFTIYSIDSDSMNVMPVSVKKEENEITATYITKLVQSNIGEGIYIDDVKMEENTVIVSFFKKGKPIKNCSKKMENMILESFANSLLDNVEGCEKIIFRCEGKAYKSQNHKFGVNEVYLSE